MDAHRRLRATLARGRIWLAGFTSETPVPLWIREPKSPSQQLSQPGLLCFVSRGSYRLKRLRNFTTKKRKIAGVIQSTPERRQPLLPAPVYAERRLMLFAFLMMEVAYGSSFD